MSRRRFLLSAGALGAAAWLAPRGLSAGIPDLARGALPGQDGPVQQIRRAAATEAIRVQRLRGGLSFLSGNGGNIVAMTGADGVLLVESGIVGRRVSESVATLGRAPVRHVVNTHWHFDHTDANAWHAGRGATIIAHENARKHMTKATRVEDWNFTFPPAAAAALPTTRVAAERTLQVNGSAIVLRPYPRSHTDSDLSVHFTDADVLHAGDTWWNGIYPFIDYSTGGSIDGMITAARATLTLAGPRTMIIPGHGAVGDRAQLSRFHDMLVAVRQRVAALKRQGRTSAETVAARPTAAFDAAWGRGVIGPDFFTRLVYQGV